jgi:uncharacterized integral membrane protein
MKAQHPNIRLIGSLLLVGLIVVFVVQNTASVEVRFLFWRGELPRSILIFLVLVIGIVVGWLIRGHLAWVRTTDNVND